MNNSYPGERERGPYTGHYVPADFFSVVPDASSPTNFALHSNPLSSETMAMARNPSNSSSLSNFSMIYTPSPSHFDYENDMDVSPPSPAVDPWFQPPEISYFGPPIKPTYNPGFHPTPRSLGWTNVNQALEVYSFKVPKGKEPYFELLSEQVPSSTMPKRVYLDNPGSQKKNTFPCEHPGGCPGKQSVFSRPADLERHYKNVHEQNHDRYSCDYPKCTRSKQPFTRKDHFRDHLRDFHKEDIGCAKMAKKSRNNKQEYAKLQQEWLKERIMRPGSWRCAKCLVKVDARTHGWDCPQCKVPCEEDRVKARQLLVEKESEKEEASPYRESMGMSNEQIEYYSYSGSTACSVCNGTGGIGDIYGAWQPCAHTQEYYL